MKKTLISACICGLFASPPTHSDLLDLRISGYSAGISEGYSGPGRIDLIQAAAERVDFRLRGAQISQRSNIYLAYSKSTVEPWPGIPAEQGELVLDPQSLDLITSVQYTPDFFGTPLAESGYIEDVIPLSVDLTDLQGVGEVGDILYFQALILPLDENGEFLWTQAQVTGLHPFELTATDNHEG